jgi:hypothetical protein
MILDPGHIMRAKAGAGDKVEFFIGQPCHRQVGLYAAACVEKLRVCQSPCRLVDIVGADPV